MPLEEQVLIGDNAAALAAQAFLRMCNLNVEVWYLWSYYGSTATDREPTDPDWVRRAAMEIFYYPRAILPKPSLCDEITGNRWFAVSLFVISLSQLVGLVCLTRMYPYFVDYKVHTRYTIVFGTLHPCFMIR